MKGLVLGGGGSRGAYQVGVWKALNELQITFDVVCGSSIGALNGVLVVQNDYEACLQLWESLRIHRVVNADLPDKIDMDSFFDHPNRYKKLLGAYWRDKGINIAPLEKVVRNLYNADKFFSSPINFACMRTNVSKLKADPIMKKDMHRDDVVDHILASASCFPTFPMRKIKDELFIDGGYSETVPIRLAKSLGATSIVAVDLSGKAHPYYTRSETSCYIQPYRSLGAFFDFRPKTIQENIRIGYHDTLKAYGNLFGYQYTFYKSEKVKIEACVAMLHKFNMDKIPKALLILQDMQKKTTRKEMQGFPLLELRLLELCAHTLQIDDVRIYSFRSWLDEIYTILETSTSSYTKCMKEASSMKERIKILKKERLSANLLVYLYQKIKENNIDEHEDIAQYISALPEKVYIAYVLNCVKKEYYDEI
ncbi:MAG: patatin-like phospholipase family protein [Breznakia sp.]